MSASDADGGNGGAESRGNHGSTGLPTETRQEPAPRRHETRLQRCLTETGERRIVVYQPKDGCWIDAAEDDVLELSEMC